MHGAGHFCMSYLCPVDDVFARKPAAAQAEDLARKLNQGREGEEKREAFARKGRARSEK